MFFASTLETKNLLDAPRSQENFSVERAIRESRGRVFRMTLNSGSISSFRINGVRHHSSTAVDRGTPIALFNPRKNGIDPVRQRLDFNDRSQAASSHRSMQDNFMDRLNEIEQEELPAGDARRILQARRASSLRSQPMEVVQNNADGVVLQAPNAESMLNDLFAAHED